MRCLDYTEVMELYEMRAVSEGTAARLAARAASDVELDELDVLNDRLAEAGTGPDAARINRIFHATLLDTAKNRFPGEIHVVPAKGSVDPWAFAIVGQQTVRGGSV